MNGINTIKVIRTPMNLPPCMGGFCLRRETCARYHMESHRTPAERLCSTDELTAYQAMSGVQVRRITRYAA